MPRRSSGSKKTPRRKVQHEGQSARSVLHELEKIAEEHPGKNPIAVFLGSRGGPKGGRNRMASLTPEERKELARKGAKARWGK